MELSRSLKVKLTPQHFVVLTQYTDYDRGRGPYVGRNNANSSWAIANNKYHLAGLVGIFGRKSAARCSFKARCEIGSPESIQQLKFVRSFSKRGAASMAIQGRGELHSVRSFSRKEVALEMAKDREDLACKARADIVRYRKRVEETREKHPHISRARIPQPGPDHPEQEQVYLDRYAICLHRCGALINGADRFHKTLETGCSDHQPSREFVEIISQHDEGHCA